ncbi:MAG TPA: DUF4270 family protein [Puia sp.]|jgi:hypothetical protein|nr:DUF4270 family protein [Puia sp.]
MTIIHHYLRKELLILSSFLLAFSFLTSCEKQPDLGQFGYSNVSDNNSANIVVVDSSTVLLSTVYVDSVASSATTFLQVGTYNDAYMGKVSSQAYLQIRPPANLPALDPQRDFYDSIGMALFFRKSNPYYGDTTIPQTFEVHQVVDTLYQLNEPSQNGWYSNNYLPIGPSLGSTTVSIAPNLPYTSQNAGDTVKIRMDDALGQQLFNMAYNKSDTLDLTTFLNWFKGLCITPGPGPGGCMYGFFDSCLMRVYYRENNNGAAVTKSIDFTLYNRPAQWNYITNDRNGSPITNLVTPTNTTQPPPATPSPSTGHASYVDNMLGLTTKMTFPYLSAISQRPDYVGLLRAQLTIIPLAGSFNTTWTLPPQVGIYSTDLHNQLGGPVFPPGTGTQQTGNLVPNYFAPLLSAYTYDVTSFVAYQIGNTSQGANQVGMMLSITSPANLSQWRRLAIADQSFPTEQRVILSVYYISLYPHQ